MTKRDKAGRPIIAITGIGLVTPLGVGKADNWAKLSAGQSGIRRITRFPIEGLRTTIAGAVDHTYKDYTSPAALSERIAVLAGEEAIAEAGIGSKGSFPGAAVSRRAAARNRMALPPRHGGRGQARRRRRLFRADRRRPRAEILDVLRVDEIRHHRRAPRRAFRHPRLADLAQHRLRLGRAAPSSSASKRSAAASARSRSPSAPTAR